MTDETLHSALQEAGQPAYQRHFPTLALLLLSLLLVGLCAALSLPFVPPLVWALLLAVLMQPVHRWIVEHVHSGSLAALLTIAVTVVVLVLPIAFAVTQITVEVSQNVSALQSHQGAPDLQSLIARNPWLTRATEWLQGRVDLRDQIGQASQRAVRMLSGLMLGSAYALVQWLIAFYMLFFFLRDRAVLLDWLARLLPLSRTESNGVFRRVRDTLYAVALGGMMISLCQGIAVAATFTALGLPSPLMWAGVMAILALIPVVGTSSVWVCATLYLLLKGDWVHAVIMAVCAGLALGVIDNVLYPMLVKGRLDIHPVPVFIALLGGVAAFGASGIILGPLVLAMTLALREVWLARFQSGLP